MSEQKQSNPSGLAVVPPGSKRETFVKPSGVECYVDSGFMTERYMAAHGKQPQMPPEFMAELVAEKEAERPRKPFIVRARTPRDP